MEKPLITGTVLDTGKPQSFQSFNFNTLIQIQLFQSINTGSCNRLYMALYVFVRDL